MSSNRNPLSAFVLLDCFLTQIEFQQVEHTWRAPQLQLVAVPVLRRLHQHFSPFLACAETGLSVTDAMGLWLERRRRKVHDLTCTIDSRKMCFSSFMYVCVCVCTDESVFPLFLSGECSHSLYYLSAPFSSRHTVPSHEGVSDSVAQDSHFPPCCAPWCAILLQ